MPDTIEQLSLNWIPLVAAALEIRRDLSCNRNNYESTTPSTYAGHLKIILYFDIWLIFLELMVSKWNAIVCPFANAKAIGWRNYVDRSATPKWRECVISDGISKLATDGVLGSKGFPKDAKLTPENRRVACNYISLLMWLHM